MASRKRGKPDKTEKKLTFQSVALGCTALAAMLAGAWVLFPQEMSEAVKAAGKAAGLQPEDPEAPPLPILKPGQGGAATAQTTQAELPQVSVNLPSAQAELPALVPAGTGQPAPPPMSCPQAAGKLRGFLDDLEKKSYLKEFNLRQPLGKHIDGLKDKLAAKPPAVVRETDDLYTVISNTAHFFRVIGKDNISLIKSILEHEQGSLEDAAAALHAASVGPDCPADTIQVPFNTAYEYSVFFVNTIGGRSYLFRRDAKVRLLINYYALLLIDEGGNRNLNTHGTDISSLIQPLIREIEANSQLARKEEYLAKLRGLAERHPAR